MSKRSDILLQQAVALQASVKFAKSVRDDLRDNYAAKLAAANEELDAFQAERDEALARLNARLVAEGQPEVTIPDLNKRLP